MQAKVSGSRLAESGESLSYLGLFLRHQLSSGGLIADSTAKRESSESVFVPLVAAEKQLLALLGIGSANAGRFVLAIASPAIQLNDVTN